MKEQEKQKQIVQKIHEYLDQCDLN